VVTNLELDHPDEFSDLADVTQSFRSFLARRRGERVALLGVDDPGAAALTDVDGPRRGGDHACSQQPRLVQHGALGLIARSAKGPLLDEKFGNFLKSADREGMLLGAYHFVTMDQDPALQADRFVDRVRAIARAKGISGKRILMVGDFDTLSTPDRLVSFIQRVHQRTGIYPVTYLENSDGLRSRLRNASPAQKSIIRRSPYWLALYGPGGTERVIAGGSLTPDSLTELYGIWDSWVMWQYGGVIWENGASRAKHYNTPAWRSPRFFGNLSHPMERNVFKGSVADLRAFWFRHSIGV
jgi:GH25 family lysozyme M1 (1,4-beta-N-acetylmuramidase)